MSGFSDPAPESRGLATPIKRRIGVFGGAFDPPHLAHVALARLALSFFALDELHVVPTGHAWHKSRTLTDAALRLRMTQLAFEDLPNVVVDDREILRAGPTYTIDTLQDLQAQHPGAQIYLIMGADQFATFERWHRWRDILEIAIICIAGRAQVNWAPGQFDAYKELEHRFLALPLPPIAISATQIRRLLATGAGDAQDLQNLHGLVPEAVARYISTHHLYRSP